jgi:hypothetical protein
MQDGSMGYQLEFDKAKAKDFSKALESTKFGKKVKACDPSAFKEDSAADTTDSTPQPATVKVWVSQWGHEFTKLEISNTNLDGDKDASVNLTLSPTLNQTVDIKAPTGPKSFDEISRELESLFGGMGGTTSDSSLSI